MSERDETRPGSDWLVPALEAVIFASDEPVALREIAEAFGGMELGEVEQAIQALEAQYARGKSGLCLERIAGGVRLATRPEVGAWVRQFFRQRNRTRLSPAALETLAIVAYRQPVTAPEIQAIRAKDPVAAIRGLLDKKLIRILGRKKVVGSPLMYGTGHEFLVHFGLNGLDDLPSIEEFDQFLEIFRGAGEEAAGEVAEDGSAPDAQAEEDRADTVQRFEPDREVREGA